MSSIIGTAVRATIPYSDPPRLKYGHVVALQDGLAIVKWHGCHVTQSVLPQYLSRMVAS